MKLYPGMGIIINFDDLQDQITKKSDLDVFQLKLLVGNCSNFPLRIAPVFMKDAHSAESNENSMFRFLFFELWLIVFTIYGGTPGISSVSPIKKKIIQI